MTLTPKALLLGCAALLAACGGGDDDMDGGSDRPDIRRPDGSVNPWTNVELAEDGVGDQLDLALYDDGRAAVAYYSTTSVNVGACEGLEGTDRQERTLYYAEETTASSGTLTQSEVADIAYLSAPPGLDIEIDPTGAPAISGLVGDPIPARRYCGASDAGFYRRDGGTWTRELAITESGQAATGEAASDFGAVVGYYASLAYDSQGRPAIAYKDVHNGMIQGDDLRRADLELGWRRGGWDAIPVDWGQGAGDDIVLEFDPDDHPVIGYYIPVAMSADVPRQGIWVSRTMDDATFERVRLVGGPIEDGLDLGFDAEGVLHVVYYSVDDGQPVLATLTDPTKFTIAGEGWTQTRFGDAQYDEGYEPSLAFDAEGHLGVTYYRCAFATSGLGECSAAEDGVVFAYRDESGFHYELVDAGSPDAACGRTPSLAFDGEGRARIAYQCQSLEDAMLVDRIRLAKRAAL